MSPRTRLQIRSRLAASTARAGAPKWRVEKRGWDSSARRFASLEHPRNLARSRRPVGKRESTPFAHLPRAAQEFAIGGSCQGAANADAANACGRECRAVERNL